VAILANHLVQHAPQLNERTHRDARHVRKRDDFRDAVTASVLHWVGPPGNEGTVYGEMPRDLNRFWMLPKATANLYPFSGHVSNS
jgi:hypothetical protein